MVVYRVLSSLGLEVVVRPIFDDTTLDDEFDEKDYKWEAEDYKVYPANYIELFGPIECQCPCYQCSLDGLCCGECLPAKKPEFYTFQEWKSIQRKISRVGIKFHGFKTRLKWDNGCTQRQEWEEVCDPYHFAD